ncbi:hypothetical protein E2562_006015 [Oryza meyeriana var. granulata]|uniref:Uncharacterized protein n=1 Tax=Oryza meyeriana var. granulata TaxID=110450 RepID=A0A6G1EVF2_9ORYZ|nr:hypothetical protein E2562_006015 [Oryza meyeriana var. granulata]
MQGCFSFRVHRRQSLRHGGGGVTVVSRGDGGGGGGGTRVKIVVGEDELDRIVAGVTRRQCGRRPRHVEAPDLLQQQQASAAAAVPMQRRRPESEGGALVAARRGEWQPSLHGIPEEGN